ncbi:MAG: pteridine reductase [Methylococcaceae bacterium]|nr:MAG: pteridine reductase [Methylococcaceae bacterium]
MSATPRCVLITGAAKRIGAAIAACLHAAGYNLIVHCHHSASDALALAETCNITRPDSARVLQLDLAQTEALDDFIAQAVSFWGSLDVLVNNASAFYPTPLQHTTAAQWQALLDANLKAPFFLCQAAVPWLKRRRGNIVNITDIHAARGLPGYAAYSASKAGLVSLTHCLAKELAPEVRVNAVAPGAILWPERAMDEAEQAGILARIPLQRLGCPADIAKAVLFLAQDADYVTGQVLAVDGGRSLV